MEDIKMNRYMYPTVFGLLVLGLGLLGGSCNVENSSDQGWPPDTILAVKMSDTYNVTAPSDTTAVTMSLYTSYDPADTSATWPPDTIMFIAIPDTI